jgi:hypothetical protein
MANYRIPDPFLPGFKAINDLSEEEIKTIADFIINVPPGITGNRFKEKLTTGIPINGISDIADTLLSLGNLLTRSTIEEISDGLASGYNKSQEKKLSKDEENNLSHKIHLLIERLENFKLTVKAMDLLSETNNMFIESRILTDVRPIFEKYSDDLNGNALILHQLRIEYISNEENKKFFVSLDLDDLKKLMENIDRAINKQSAIEEKYKSITNFIDITV